MRDSAHIKDEGGLALTEKIGLGAKERVPRESVPVPPPAPPNLTSVFLIFTSVGAPNHEILLFIQKRSSKKGKNEMF